MAYMKDSTGRRLDSFEALDLDIGRESFSPVLAHKTLVADAPAVSFNNLPAGYGELIIVGQVRATNASTNTTLRMTINNDMLASNYVSQRLRATNTTVDAANISASPYFQVADITGGTVADTAAAGTIEIHLPNYDGTVFEKEFYCDYHYAFGTSASQYVGKYAGRYIGGSQAIRQVTFTAAAGDLKAGTTFTVYGRNTGAPITTSDPLSNLVLEGDSLTASATGGGTAYPIHLSSKLETTLMTNKATASESLVDITAQAADMDLSYKAGFNSVLAVWGGTNDLTLVTDPDGPTIYARYRDYCLARKAVGWKILAFTLTPRTGLIASKQTALDYFNTQVRANWATFADAIYDVAAVANFADPSNVTYYADGLHQTDAGREIIATDVAVKLATLGVATV
jgi:lysophospholipase L1-like esterase